MIIDRNDFNAILDIADDFLDESDESDARLAKTIRDIRDRFNQLDNESRSQCSKVSITAFAVPHARQEAQHA
jgi:hypothetical protein